MITIHHHVSEGYELCKNEKGFYPKKSKGKDTDFDVKTAKWSQQASQVASFVGLFSCVKRLTQSSELLFKSVLKEASGMVERIEILDQTAQWCEKELGTLTEANEANFIFGTNFDKGSNYKYETEHGLFTRDTMPTGFKEQYAKCHDIPELDLLDEDPLNIEGQLVDAGIQSFKQKYSDPYGIYYKWIASQTQKSKRAIEKKKERMKKKKKKMKFEPKKIQKSVRQVELKRDKYKFVGRPGASKKKKDNNEQEQQEQEQQQEEQRQQQQQQEEEQEQEEQEEQEEQDNEEEDEDEEEQEQEDEEDEGEVVAAPPPPPPGAPPVLKFNNLSTAANSSGGGMDIFAAIRGGNFQLRKVEETEKVKPKSERGLLLESIRSFNSKALKPASERKLGVKKSANKRAPLNVGEILQQQLQMIAQAGNEDDDEDEDEDDWDEDDDDDW